MPSLLAFLLSAAFFLDHVQATRDFRPLLRGLNASDGVSYASGATAGHPSASASAAIPCSDVWMSWLNNSTRYMPTWTTYLETYDYYNITAATTTACDGHPRVVGGSGALTTLATGTNSTLTSAPKNFTVPTPTCRLSPSECTGKLASYSLCTGGPTTSSSDCGPCSIWGGTVQLNYFPITRNATQNLCQTGGNGSPTLCPLAPTGTPYSVANPFGMTPCDYITDNATSTRNSGPYLVSDGQTFYQNRVYVSLDTAYASNSCGYVGKQYAGTTLTLASTDVYSVHGYHHEFNDIGYQFDFADHQNVPADKYYANCGGGQDPICIYSGTDYRHGTDFINGRSDIDFGVGNAVGDGHTGTGYQWIWQGAYSPTLLVPLQIRTLDPAWSTCSLNLVGLYDPPRVLTGELTSATPTAPTVPTTSEPAPAATVTSDGPPVTTTASPDPTSRASGEEEYTAPTHSYDQLPSTSASSEHSPGQQEELEPTNGSQDPAGETSKPLGDIGASGTYVPESEPSPHVTDPSRPVASTQPSPSSPSTDGPNPAKDSASPNDALSTNLPAEANHPPATASTTQEIGGIIASILGAQPKPTTTTNALSVLESAAQTYGDDDEDPTAAPSNGLPQPPLQETTPLPPAPPITLSDEDQTHTLEPLPGSEALYTVVTPEPDSTAPEIQSETEKPNPLPKQPVVLTADGYTQTVQPVRGSSGLYTVIGQGTADSSAAGVSSDSSSNQDGEAMPFFFTGPATFVAGGRTHTIKPVQSSSGVFVIDGSRTLTQLAPSSVSDPGDAEDSSSDNVTGSASPAESTIASASGDLPPVVTLPSAQPSRSGGNEIQTAQPPPQNIGQRSCRAGGLGAWVLVASVLLMYI